ncbi:DUF488 family protein [Pleionea sp. CnH1-48]|uniref:DUF488 domain-containing protein n=1 Tax=Pleionea sp. CnH1-48 TaxID=2954494 RepID=UPI00209787F5|nr:DUF488 domain-containing protein [Pleionea sp. CnH1-48]MCO7224065.1 DUF488 domain-containing protein [Pleionea sp. CnH1-48]
MHTVYTIGYATKAIDTFIKQLQQYDITVVADVRSVPYSKAFYDYHQEALQQHLKSNNIRYVYLGEELGPRSKDPNHYDESNQVQFEKLMTSALFSTGISRLKTGLDRHFNIALMCAEKDPANCHRSTLIAYYLARNESIQIKHITHDGHIESQTQLEERLLELTQTQPDLISSKEECLQRAYYKHIKTTAYRKPADD